MNKKDKNKWNNIILLCSIPTVSGIGIFILYFTTGLFDLWTTLAFSHLGAGLVGALLLDLLNRGGKNC